ncbi:MAG: hypothetical protein MI799_02475 [Desulfobacterales bacterium]|nr:hypothetical protein [Desulfobacterales bacterium]
MAIKEINEFQVIDLVGSPDDIPRILLKHQKLKKQIEVLGKVLEAQYRVGNNFLILVTEGNPFEEALYIYYFNNRLQIIDALELSAMYAGGMLRNIYVAGPNEIKFSFFDNSEQWVLKIFSSPKYTMFNNKYPAKRKLSVFHKNWLSLQKS